MFNIFSLGCLIISTLSQIQTTNGAKPIRVGKITPRLIGGAPSVVAQFPHQVNLEILSASGQRLKCGGALINERWVLTAAHCLAGRTQVLARLGSVDFNSPQVLDATSRLFVHPNYSPNNLNNDVGLVDLGVDVTFTSNIRAIRLPARSQFTNTFAGRQATVSGWGYTTNSGPSSTTLNFLRMNVVTNTRCRQNFSAVVIISSTLCTTGINPGEGACIGDSGSPLIVRDPDGQDTLIGIVSFVSNVGCDADYPSAFSRLTSFVTWISQITGIAIRP